MNNIRKTSHQKLEISQILDNLCSIAILPEVKSLINSLTPSNDIEYLKKELEDVDEALRITTRFERAPIMMDSDFRNILNLAFKGAKLSAVEIYDVEKLFLTVKANFKLASSLVNEKIDSPNYQKLVSELEVIDYLDALIVKSVNENGEVLDSASSTLKQIRSKLSNIDTRIKSKCQEILSREMSKLSQTSIVMRNDCYCLAVKSEYKNSIRGTIQDYSSSMQTVYIEPEAVASLMREKNILYHEEHDEIEKILKNISESIRNEVARLTSIFDNIVIIDFIFSKAILAQSYNGNKQNININGLLNLINARHPLLKVKKVIPNNIKFDKSYYGIIITGPNTGGKTVLLKTVGLLVLMTKYGLLIPADVGSDVMLYDDVYCDIGDDQSIENNLSTFSSHMHNIVDIINSVTPRSLVLFDEIGAGTDPIEGSNLAKAILKHLIDKQVSFMTTTHYSDLKAFGFEEPRIINASMEFDQNTLSPTYNLLIGVSGSSNALNIAARLGLKSDIIEEANRLTITNDSEVRKLILKLERLVSENEQEKSRLNQLLKENEETKKLLNNELNKLDDETLKIIKKAQAEAEKIVESAKNDGNKLLEEIQEKQKNKLKLHEMIELKKKLNELDVKSNKKKPKNNNISDEPVVLGDDVYIPSYDQYGNVIKIRKDKTYDIAIGNISINLERAEFNKIKKEPVRKDNKVITNHTMSKANISLVLDLRGERYVDAQDRLDKYVDDLVLVGIKQATIIHGYGTGAIREMVQSYVRKSPHIASSRYGGENEGGFGVTVITLK